MTRFLVTVLTAAALGGFALGWFVLSGSSGEPPDEAPPPGPERPPAQVVHRFPLSAADARQHRETPAVAVDGDRVVVAWATANGPDCRTLWLTRSADGGVTFDRPAAFRSVPLSRQGSRSSTVVPRLSAAGGVIYLGWTEAEEGGRVRFLVARSADGGQTFSSPTPAHGAAARPAFTGLSAAPGGGVVAAWLESRHRRQQPFCAVSDSTGTRFAPEALAHGEPGGPGVCPCCDVDVLRTLDGTTLVAFRDNEDRRDICVTRSKAGGRFERSVRVNRERWVFPGCPHDGPSLAFSGDQVHVAWMDAHTGRRRVYHASSPPGELRFTPREVCPDAPGDQGHPRLAGGGGALHAAWDASQVAEVLKTGHHAPSGVRTVYHARLGPDGSFGPARAVAPREGALQVNPALAAGPAGEAYLTWNEVTEAGKSVVVVRIPPRDE